MSKAPRPRCKPSASIPAMSLDTAGSHFTCTFREHADTRRSHGGDAARKPQDQRDGDQFTSTRNQRRLDGGTSSTLRLVSRRESLLRDSSRMRPRYSCHRCLGCNKTRENSLFHNCWACDQLVCFVTPCLHWNEETGRGWALVCTACWSRAKRADPQPRHMAPTTGYDATTTSNIACDTASDDNGPPRRYATARHTVRSRSPATSRLSSRRRRSPR